MIIMRPAALVTAAEALARHSCQIAGQQILYLAPAAASDEQA
jgi:hypothetical protein